MCTENNIKIEKDEYMKLNKIEDIIKNNTDKSRFNSGFAAYKKNKVINDYSKIEFQEHLGGSVG